MIDLQSYKNKLNQLFGQRDLLIRQKSEADELIISLSEKLDVALQARSVVQIVAESTQAQITYHISNLVSSALAAVFPDPYKFELRFVQRRNKTEADLIFIKDGNETDDLTATGGGGACDIASLALRIALWSIRKTRNTLLLDEPTKFLHSPLYQEKTSEMLKEISDKLKLQIIMISDQPQMIKAADKVINITNVKGVSIASV